jgi:hypothetical protein
MTAGPGPELDLAALLAAKVFDEDDLAHNRRGVLSPKQEAWREANPRFMDDDDEHDGAMEVLLGRVAIEGRYVAGGMGQTTFAKLVLPGRSLSLRPALQKRLVRDAPYRAYAADGWIWSIEPITEDELRANASGIATYRSSGGSADTTAVARALEEALSAALSFSQADVVANAGGRFSTAQRSVGRKKLFFAAARAAVSCGALWGLVALLDAGAPFPILAAFFGIVALLASCAASAWSLVDALARLVQPKPLCTLARLERDPTNRDNLVLESEGRPLKISARRSRSPRRRSRRSAHGASKCTSCRGPGASSPFAPCHHRPRTSRPSIPEPQPPPLLLRERDSW